MASSALSKPAMPAGTGALYFINLFSTIGFAVLYSTLVLYATRGLHLPDIVATSMIATYVAFNFALHLLGGFVGGRFMSYRSLFCVGMLLQFAGCLVISLITLNSLYWGLAFFLAGSGLNVTCINCMLTQLFEPEDKRRETAFLWNYSGMNVGFFVAFAVAGIFQIHDEYHILFMLTALGNFMAFLFTVINWKSLHDVKTTYSESSAKNKRVIIGLSIILLLVLFLRVVLARANLSSNLIMLLGGFMALLIPVLAQSRTAVQERHRMWSYYILAWGSLTFWVLYQMIPMGLTLFIERNINRNLLGIMIPPQWINDINTIVIVVGGPLVAVITQRLRDRGYRIGIPFLFACALIFIGSAVAILPLGIHFSNLFGYTSVSWIILSYVLLSVGELCMGPIGYAMVGQLAPPRLRGLLMGTWMMIVGIAATLSNVFSDQALGNTKSMNPLITNSSFSHTFNLLGWTSIAVGLLFFILKPVIYRLMHEDK